MSDDDELASINGVRPKKYLADGEKDMVGSKSSSRKYGELTFSFIQPSGV